MDNESQLTRRDSFDIGTPEIPQSGQGQGQMSQPLREDILIKAISNPDEVINSLGLNDEQCKNLQALITGGGAALGVKYLSNAFGIEIGGALGAILGGYVSRKIVKKSKKSTNRYFNITEGII